MSKEDQNLVGALNQYAEQFNEKSAQSQKEADESARIESLLTDAARTLATTLEENKKLQQENRELRQQRAHTLPGSITPFTVLVGKSNETTDIYGPGRASSFGDALYAVEGLSARNDGRNISLAVWEDKMVPLPITGEAVGQAVVDSFYKPSPAQIGLAPVIDHLRAAKGKGPQHYIAINGGDLTWGTNQFQSVTDLLKYTLNTMDFVEISNKPNTPMKQFAQQLMRSCPGQVTYTRIEKGSELFTTLTAIQGRQHYSDLKRMFTTKAPQQANHLGL